MMDSRLTVHIHAPPERLFALIADVEGWPRLLPHYRWVRRLAADGSRWTLEMAAWRSLPGLRGRGYPVRWTAVVEPDDAALFGRETLALEIYAPDGTLVASSIEPVAPEVAVWPGIVPASYVVRVRNVGTAPIGYSGAIVRTQAF